VIAVGRTVLLQNNLSGGLNKKGKMNMACRTHVVNGNTVDYNFLVGKPAEKRRLRNLGADERIILKRIREKER
jgi:hypothetical protein